MPKRSKTLRSRLTTLVVVSIFGAVAIATSSSVWREAAQFGAGERADLKATAESFAAALADPVARQDRDAALTTLSAAASLPRITYLRIEMRDGPVFADLGEPPAPTQPEAPPGAAGKIVERLFSRTHTASAAIRHDGQEIAALTLNADSGSLIATIAQLLYDALVAAVFAGGIGVLIALRMQRMITDPISDLAKVMAVVREEENFAVRAEPARDEEIAGLVDTFNTMLDHIQERDAKLKAHRKDLERVVELRTREMRAAKDAAIAANTAKSEFLATMSHEIRTPMNGMLVMADLLSKSPLAPRHKRYADVIAKSGQGLLAIINDILDLSKIEAGRLDLEKIPVRPADIIDHVVGLFWERAASKHVDLAGYVAPNTPQEIEGDPVRINQVLSNLVNNALKFTESGHVTVSIRTKPAAADGACVLEFAVSDTGVGIPKEKQKAIFEAFSQGDQTTTRRFGGTGLGLAICRRLVEAMGGQIDVSSTPGKGSRFVFTVATRTLAPPRPMTQTQEEKRAVIAIDGDATPRVLANYLREARIIPHIVDQNAPMGPHLAYADMIFASPAFYRAYQQAIDQGKANWIPARICICELGDTAPDALVEQGVVEDILLAPLTRSDVAEQIGRILDRRLRGKAALEGAHGGEAAMRRFRGQKILAADDSAVNREVLQEALKRLNLDVTLACNGKEALALTKEQTFSLIIMDCSMPEMDGYEAAKAIRAFEASTQRPRAPIIALTAHVAGAGKDWREAGMDAHLAKPFTIDSLGAALADHLELAENAAAETAPDAATPSIPLKQPAAGPFDRAVLDQIALMQSGGVNLPVRALTLFQEHSREAVKTLASALNGGDGEAIAKAAHALRSMSLNVGARELAEICGAIEKDARAGAAKRDLAALCKRAAAALRDAHQALPAAIDAYRQPAA